jgi:hypothetical protein
MNDQFETKEIVWHDPNINSDENSLIYHRYRNKYNFSRFVLYEDAISYIENKNRIDCVLTSGNKGKEFVLRIQNIEAVSCIIIFCANIEYHSSWSQDYNKVKLVENDFRKIDAYLSYMN